MNRKGKGGKNWQPTKDDRICSAHFIDGEPTAIHPDPTINMGYDLAQPSASSKGKAIRKPPRKRELLQTFPQKKSELKGNAKCEDVLAHADELTPPVEKDGSDVPPVKIRRQFDHTYASSLTGCAKCHEKSANNKKNLKTK